LAIGNTNSDSTYYFSASRLQLIKPRKKVMSLAVLKGWTDRRKVREPALSVEMENHKQKEQTASGNFLAAVSNVFRVFARKSSVVLGSAWTFAAAIFIIVAWALTGPKFHYSDTWQLIINTGTTIVTFLMVFLIQNTQNRDAKSVHLKLDEIIRAVKGARNELMSLQESSDEDLEKLEKQFTRIRKRAEAKQDEVSPDVASSA
jgi:low affinity Fe/Cu permease